MFRQSLARIRFQIVKHLYHGGEPDAIHQTAPLLLREIRNRHMGIQTDRRLILIQDKQITVLTCKSHLGVCAKCYGANMATGQPVQVGEAVARPVADMPVGYFCS